VAINNELHRMKQNVLGVSTASLAVLSEINPNRLSLYLNGTRQLPNHELVRLEKLFNDLECLSQVAMPFPLSFRDTERIKDLISRMKLGEFSSQEKAAQE
jgi:hypothetical protein